MFYFQANSLSCVTLPSKFTIEEQLPGWIIHYWFSLVLETSNFKKFVTCLSDTFQELCHSVGNDSSSSPVHIGCQEAWPPETHNSSCTSPGNPVGLKGETKNADHGKRSSRAQGRTLVKRWRHIQMTQSALQAGSLAQWWIIYSAFKSPWVRSLELKGGSKGGTKQPITRSLTRSTTLPGTASW